MPKSIGTALAGVIFAIVGAALGTAATQVTILVCVELYDFGTTHPWVPAVSALMAVNFCLRDPKAKR